ncbi:hypothetical protein SDC9_179862 [bioreactor metagenome]|uniref:Uncharacterized protein n=2 Tax=root TaxID=1 RepID=A0A645H7Y3_9ZZZZ
MDFNYIENYIEDDINVVVVKDVLNFELPHIFECG